MSSESIISRRETTKEKRAEVWTWYKAGKTYSEIGRRTDLTKSTVAGIIQREKKKTGQDRFSSAPRSGRPPKVTPKAKRRLLRAASKDTRATLAALSTPSKSGKQLSKITVRKVLKQHGKARRRARRKLYLSKVHKRRRVRFGKTEKRRNWRRVCWSDEATFEIGYDNRN
jgi:transposase